MKKTIKYTEEDIERLVNKIIKEDFTGHGLSSFTDEFSRKLMSLERDYLGNNEQLGGIIKTYESHIKQLRSIMNNNQSKVNEDHTLPRRERERHATQFAKASFEPYDREREIMNAFGPYREDVPANVVSYLRKNPRNFLKRLTDVYGMDKMLEYIGYEQNLDQDPNINL
jgi:hypothetical protein